MWGLRLHMMAVQASPSVKLPVQPVLSPGDWNQTSSRIRTLTQETCSSAFGSPGTRRVNAILLDLLPFETSVSSSLQNTILVI